MMSNNNYYCCAECFYAFLITNIAVIGMQRWHKVRLRSQENNQVAYQNVHVNKAELLNPFC